MSSMPLSRILKPLQTSPPEISRADVQQLVSSHYGIAATAVPLAGERDQNFSMKTASGKQYVLKIVNTAESQDVAVFQTQALKHIERVDPGLPVPRVISTLAGQSSFFVATGGQQAVVRMLSYLEGEPIHQTDSTAVQRFNIGQMSARLSLALRGFDHPAANHKILWDIQNASLVRELVVHIPDAANRALAERFLDRFEGRVSPVLPLLRTQVVHNDLNPHNLLVDPAQTGGIAGILDFGDMVRTALINDVAVTASYLLTPSAHPLEPVVDLLRGYQTICPLEWTEISLLPDLIATRYVMNVAITGWRAARYPGNKDYILRNNPSAWAGLRTLESSSKAFTQDYLCEQCYTAGAHDAKQHFH